MGSAEKIDLTVKEQQIISDLLKKYIPDTLVWAYGSRVKHTATKYSDLDLITFSASSQNVAISDLKTEFEESDLPFKVDLFVWDEIPEEFKANILKEYIVMQK